MEFEPWPYFAEDEIQAVVNVLKSGNVNQWTGGEINAFEMEFSEYIGTKYAVALANGSIALDLALAAFGIGPGDEVIVTPRSFVASVSCVALKGAIPVFVDVDLVSQNITLENISTAVTENTKAVIAVNLAGWPCELDKIKSFCNKKGIFLIEDCAQSHGAEYKGKKAGSYGDCSIFSFCQDKIMTTGGEGGMLLTNNKKVWEKVWSYKDHGKDYSEAFSTNHKPGFKWLVESFGTNGRMTEMQAAMGRLSLKKLNDWVKKRRKLAYILSERFKQVPGLRLTVPEREVYHSYYKYYVFIRPEELKEEWDRDKIINSLNKMQIPCNTGICPEIYMEKVFDRHPFKLSKIEINYAGGIKKDRLEHRLTEAKKLGETSMVFLVHPTLKFETIEYVADCVGKVMETATK